MSFGKSLNPDIEITSDRVVFNNVNRATLGRSTGRCVLHVDCATLSVLIGAINNKTTKTTNEEQKTVFARVGLIKLANLAVSLANGISKPDISRLDYEVVEHVNPAAQIAPPQQTPGASGQVFEQDFLGNSVYLNDLTYVNPSSAIPNNIDVRYMANKINRATRELVNSVNKIDDPNLIYFNYLYGTVNFSGKSNVPAKIVKIDILRKVICFIAFELSDPEIDTQAQALTQGQSQSTTPPKSKKRTVVRMSQHMYCKIHELCYRSPHLNSSATCTINSIYDNESEQKSYDKIQNVISALPQNTQQQTTGQDLSTTQQVV